MKNLKFRLFFSIFASNLNIIRPCKLNKQKRQRLRISILLFVRQSSPKELTGQHVQCKKSKNLPEPSLVFTEITRVVLFWKFLEYRRLTIYLFTFSSYFDNNKSNKTFILFILEWIIVHDFRRSTNSRRCQNSWEASGEIADEDTT